MALQAIVRRGKTFTDGERVTTDKLNASALPVVDIIGTVSAASIGSGLTNTNISVGANILSTKIQAVTTDGLVYSNASGLLEAAVPTGDISAVISSGIVLNIDTNAVTTAKINTGAVTTVEILDATILDGDLAATVLWNPDRLPDSTSGASLTVDWSASYTHKRTLALASAFTFSNPKDGQSILFVIEQDGTGGWTPSFTDTILWRGGSEPTWSIGADEIDIVTFLYDGTDYYGSAVHAFA